MEAGGRSGRIVGAGPGTGGRRRRSDRTSGTIGAAPTEGPDRGPGRGTGEKSGSGGGESGTTHRERRSGSRTRCVTHFPRGRGGPFATDPPIPPRPGLRSARRGAGRRDRTTDRGEVRNRRGAGSPERRIGNAEARVGPGASPASPGAGRIVCDGSPDSAATRPSERPAGGRTEGPDDGPGRSQEPPGGGESGTTNRERRSESRARRVARLPPGGADRVRRIPRFRRDPASGAPVGGRTEGPDDGPGRGQEPPGGGESGTTNREREAGVRPGASPASPGAGRTVCDGSPDSAATRPSERPAGGRTEGPDDGSGRGQEPAGERGVGR